MQNRSLGILVFPTRRSDTILCNPSLFHYGHRNRSDSNHKKKPNYLEGKSEESSNSSNISDTSDSSLNSHLLIPILTNSFENLNCSVQSNQHRSTYRIANAPGNVAESAERNESKAMLSEGKMKTTAEKGLIGWESSNHSKGFQFSQFPDTNITGTSGKSWNISDRNFSRNAKLSPLSDAMQAKQKLIEGIIQRRSLAESKQYDICRENNNANRTTNENSNNSKDQSALNKDGQLERNLQRIASVSDDLLLNDSDSEAFANKNDEVRNACGSNDNKEECGLSANKIKGTISISEHLNDRLIQELKQLPNGMISLRDYKQKQKNLIIEKQKLLKIDSGKTRKACTPDEYISEVCEFISGTTKPLTTWKDQMLAANEEGPEEAEEFGVRSFNGYCQAVSH